MKKHTIRCPCAGKEFFFRLLHRRRERPNAAPEDEDIEYGVCYGEGGDGQDADRRYTNLQSGCRAK